MNIFLRDLDGGQKCLSCESGYTAEGLRSKIRAFHDIRFDDYYLLCNGKILQDDDTLQNDSTVHVVPRLVGGKGGFGSMLRAIGAQIEKTTNREACRDLSGRRMRDVNNEKKLRDWVARQADREKDREQRRRDRMERRRAVPKHHFNDPTYEAQKSKVIENLDEALQEGLKSAAGTSGASGSSQDTSRKRKSAMPETATSKKSREWLGMDIDPDDLSDLDSDDSESESSASPGPLNEDSSSNSAPGLQKGPDSDSGVESIDTKTKNTETNEASPSTTDAEDKGESNDGSKDESRPEEPSGKETNSSSSRDKSKETPSAPVPEAAETPNKPEGPVEVDLSLYSCAGDLEALGLDGLKAALIARGMKCGGTLTERAQRLFSVKGLTPDQIPPSLLSKGQKVKGKGKK